MKETNAKKEEIKEIVSEVYTECIEPGLKTKIIEVYKEHIEPGINKRFVDLEHRLDYIEDLITRRFDEIAIMIQRQVVDIIDKADKVEEKVLGHEV